MSAERTDFEEKLRDRLAQLIWEEGRVMIADPDDWGWHDPTATVHLRACSLQRWEAMKRCEIFEAIDEEAGAIFSEGLEMSADCVCGALVNRRVMLLQSFDSAVVRVLAESILDD